MKLNEDSIKQLDDVNKIVRKNYYIWLDDNDRLTVTLVDDQDKTLQECIGITIDTINKLNSVTPPQS